jgi:hypothetical protein
MELIGIGFIGLATILIVAIVKDVKERTTLSDKNFQGPVFPEGFDTDEMY